VLAKSPVAATRRSTGSPLLRKHGPTATISGKGLSGRTGTIPRLSSPTEHGPGYSLCPHTREAGTASPRKRKRRPERRRRWPA
jgi:hypothetical protein